MIRTHRAGTLTSADEGAEITLAGWVDRRRDHGGVAFLDLRDASGVVQVVVNDPDVAHGLRDEYCLRIVGKVRRRPEGNENPDIPTGSLEVEASEVEVLSQFGQGTTVRIRLPLTLAIIDGFQVRVADEAFVLPLDQVVECVDLGQQADLHDLLNLRGEPLPYVRLRSLFGLPPSVGARESLVVVQFGSNRAGVVVDQLVGELQAVIKPLGQIFAQNKVLSGSTILGDGSVALILDVAHLIQRASAAAERSAGSLGRSAESAAARALAQ